jgi:hypothetical protein
MPQLDAPSAMRCPNCRQPMQAQQFEQNYHGTVRVDLCFACAGIWFDHLGSVQLAPGAVIELFKEIHARLDASGQALKNRLQCPRCEDALALGYDLCKSGRFSYYRCERGDGRFTPFVQFLREKQFVRNLSTAELERLRLQIRQVRCSECGAPIDLEHANQCSYCHSPIAFLDQDAVQNAVHLWTEAEQRRHLRPDPQVMADVLGKVLSGAPEPTGAPAQGLDLVAAGIRVIARLF